MATGDNGSGLLANALVAGISIIGALTKTTEWRDARTGNFSKAAMVSGVATCLILAAIVRWAGDQYGVSTTAQVMIAGVLCYVGPDPIIRGLANVALKRIGIQGNGDGNAPKNS